MKNLLFAPLSLLYGLGVHIRHKMFDAGILKSVEFDIPIVCVGNIAVGGTGKTPHTEYLISYLSKQYTVGVLSRGYGRKTRGFIEATRESSYRQIGDEPKQIKQKFPNITVCVCEKRVEGIRKMRELHPEINLIILDDAFQHRALKPTLSIVLIDHNRPSFQDFLLPLGRLRDLPERVHEADVLIVTKCPYDMNSWQKCTWADNLGLKNFNAKESYGIRPDGQKQYLFFTSITYDTPEAIFPEGDPRYIHSKRLILFSGIANDTPMARWLSGEYKIVKRFKFPDHHQFSKGNIASISSAALAHSTAVVMTTEKDAQRIRDCKRLSYDMKMRMFFLPIKTRFVEEEEEKIFISVVRKSLTGSDSEIPPTPREWY
jgi:tetraacyldisaccharide 4'-kinase